MISKTDIERQVAALKGKVLWGCRRAANMAMFDFGARRKVTNSKGIEKEVGELALHVQCAWRISRNEQVVVGSHDLRFPADYSEEQQVPEAFDWDQDPNRLDKLLHALFQDATRDFVVQSVQLGNAGALRAVLNDDLVLEVFPDDSLSLEHWRLFVPGAHQPHLVVRGTGWS